MNLIEKLTEYRRDLHMIPELDTELEKTASYVENVLDRLSCRVSRVEDPKGKNRFRGILAYFDFGKDSAICFRSDMDALPITEQNDVSYRSEHEGAMHACGHDGHMAMLLAFAEVLDAGQVKPNHNVLLVFQPAEETTGGARVICRSRAFEKYNVKNVFGIHLWPYIDAGKLSSRKGPMMAKSSEINIDIEGVSAHCTAAEEGRDALACGCRLLDKIYSFEEVSEEAPSILKFGKMISGDVRNAISPHTRIEGTLRCLDLETFDAIVSKMEPAASDMEEATGCKITVAHSEGYPPVTNDAKVFDAIRPALDILGFEELAAPSMIAEDFSFYQLEVPGVFMYLGTGTNIPLHSDTFDFDEKILEQGVAAYQKISETV